MDTDVLVICTTGGSQTKELRDRFPSENIIIEDFIPFADIMPYADVYVTNGGYVGVMLALRDEFASYDPNKICEQYVNELTGNIATGIVSRTVR